MLACMFVWVYASYDIVDYILLTSTPVDKIFLTKIVLAHLIYSQMFWHFKTRAKMSFLQQLFLRFYLTKLWRYILYNLLMFSRKNFQLPIPLVFPKPFVNPFELYSWK